MADLLVVAGVTGFRRRDLVSLHPLVARRLGLEPWTDIGSHRIGIAMFDVYEAMGTRAEVDR